MRHDETWHSSSNAARYDLGDYKGEWSLADNPVQVTVQSPKVLFDLPLTGSHQSCMPGDKLGVEGYIQEGALEDSSFYYSLPHLNAYGSHRFPDKAGARREVEANQITPRVQSRQAIRLTSDSDLRPMPHFAFGRMICLHCS